MTPAELLAHPWCQAATATLLHFVWQGFAIAALLAAAVQLLGIRRASTRHAWSLAALALMVACPLATLAWLGLAANEEPQIRQPAPIFAMATTLLASNPIGGGAPRMANLVATIQPYLLAAWLAGVALLASRLLMGLVGVRLLSRDRLPLPVALAERAELLRHRLGMRFRPAICLSRRVSEAMAVGLFRPIVLIPAAWATEMPLSMLEAVLAHELAHLQRRDLWINLLQRLVETLLFYHPAVWWLSRRLRTERELCCDELAVAATGRRLEYVQTLETVARKGARVEPLLAAGIRGERRMQLLTRVRNVLGLSEAGDRWRLWPAGLIALALPLGAWTAATGLVSPTTGAVVAEDDREDDDDDDDDDDRDDEGDDDDDDREDGRKDKERDDDDGDDDDEKEGRQKGDRERDDDDDDDSDKRKPGKQEKDDDDGDKREPGKREKDNDDGDKRKPGKQENDDDGERKEVRKFATKKLLQEIPDEDDRERKLRKEFRLREDERPDAREEREFGVERKEGERRIVRKDGERLEIEIRGEGDDRVADLMAAVKRLSAENHMLRTQLAQLHEQRGRDGNPEKREAAGFKQMQAELEKSHGALRDKMIKEGAGRKDAEFRELKEREFTRLREEHERAFEKIPLKREVKRKESDDKADRP